jgi:hypothetical protein
VPIKPPAPGGSPLLARLQPSTDVKGADARGLADKQRGALDGAALNTSDPSAVSVAAGQGGARLNLDGREPGGAVTHRDGDRSVGGSLGLSTGGVYGGLRQADGERATGLNAFWAPGWLSGSGSHAWATADGGTARLRGTLAWFGSGMGLGAALAKTSAQGLTGALSAMALLDADRSVTDLGPLEGEPGRRRVELRRSLSGTGVLNPGVGGPLLGLGGRISAGKSRSVVYRTAVNEAEARRLVIEDKGALKWLANKARAVGAAADPVVIPPLNRPEELAVGDELVTTVSGSFSLGLFLGGLPVRLGAYGHMRGDFELGVKRLDEQRVELVVTPLSVRGIQARAGLPWVLDADVGRQAGAALRQGFVFDLEEPAAKAAYLAALQGELPGGVAPMAAGKKRSADELVSALEEERLPPGTARTFVDAVGLKRSHRGLGSTFGLWHGASNFGGLGSQRAKLHETRASVSPGGVFYDDTRGIERRRKVLLSGDEARGVYAKKRRVTHFADDGSRETRFHSLELKLTFSDTCLRGSELDRNVIDVLNAALGLDLPPFGRNGRKKSRDVSATCTLGAVELERLAKGDAPGSLAASLRDAAGDDERADLVQRFVAEGGLEAFARVARALGEVSSSLVVTTSSSAWEGPSAELERLRLRFSKPLAVDDDKVQVTRRFADAERALVDASEGLLDVAADPLLSEDKKKAATAELVRVQEGLSSLLALDHLSPSERRALAARLERGWTTTKQHAIIARLGEC